MPLRFCLSSLCFSALIAVPIVALAAPKYSVTVVGVAGSRANGINSSGTVVGNFPLAGNTHGFVNAAGVITDLGTLGGANSFAAAINNGGRSLATHWLMLARAGGARPSFTALD